MCRWQAQIVDVVASHFDRDSLPLRGILDVLNAIQREEVEIENIANIDSNALRRAKYHENVVLRASGACRQRSVQRDNDGGHAFCLTSELTDAAWRRSIRLFIRFRFSELRRAR